MQLTIRPFNATTQDYDAIAAIGNADHPNAPLTADELRHRDATNPSFCRSERLIAVVGDRIVGNGVVRQSPFSFHPRRFMVRVAVLGDFRRQGVGAALYDALVALVEDARPIGLRTGVQEDCPEGIRFAEKRGYVEEMREWESELSLALFDPARFAWMAEKAARHGVRILSVRDAQVAYPDWDRRLHEIEMLVFQDVPFPDPATVVPFDDYKRAVLGSPSFLPDGFYVAVNRDDRFVGASALWKRHADAKLETGLTGVVRECRRMGIASALKLRALTWAKETGAPAVRTENATTNRPMLAINEALGFVKEPAQILMGKEIEDAVADAGVRELS